MSEGTVERVLHVDDESDVREVTKLALEAVGGMTVLSCASAEDALAKGAAFRPDVILLDIMMPVMDGMATLRALRGVDGLGDVPAVFMSARVGPDEDEAVRALGAAGMVSKPFNPMTLADELRAIVRRLG